MLREDIEVEKGCAGRYELVTVAILERPDSEGVMAWWFQKG
jgi:hypothetical protein